MTLTDHYRTALRRQAIHHTRRLLRKAEAGATLTLEVWGRERQDAFLDAGWSPLSESPMIDPTTGLEWTAMIMTITKHISA